MIRLIDITQDDIINGVQGDCEKCAIALALKREYKTNNVKVLVHDDTSTPILSIGSKELSIKYENDVLDFIDCYDNMDDMDIPSPKPFTLQINE